MCGNKILSKCFEVWGHTSNPGHKRISTINKKKQTAAAKKRPELNSESRGLIDQEIKTQKKKKKRIL